MNEHTCHKGPVCGYWDSPSYPECRHDTCWELTHEECEACTREWSSQLAEEARHLDFITKHCYQAPGGPFCPVDMTPLMFRGIYGAPGYGAAYECSCHHTLTCIGSGFADYVPELTLADVR
jgi:hypothetical protein